MKKLFTILALLFLSLTSFAQTIIPIPIYSGGGGPVEPKMMLAFYIGSNILIIFFFLVRYILWLIKRKDKYFEDSFYNYCIWSDFEYFYDVNTMSFISINGFAILSLIIHWIYTLLGGTMPFC